MGTMLMRRDRPAENSISRDSILGIVPISSPKITTRLGSFPPCSSAMDSISRYICCRNRLTIKYFVLSSSGSTIKIADLELQKVSVSMEPSKHRICSISESRKAFSLDMAVESTEAMA